MCNEPRYGWKDYRLERGSNPRPLVRYASAHSTELPGLQKNKKKLADKNEDVSPISSICCFPSCQHHRLKLCLAGPEFIKLFFMLNLTEHKILNANKYKDVK